MKYYNEAKSEKKIRQKAKFLTFTVCFIFVTALFFSFTDTGKSILPEPVKEWFDGNTNTPDKSAKQANKPKA